MPGFARELSKLGGYVFIDWTSYFDMSASVQFKNDLIAQCKKTQPDIIVLHVQRPGVIDAELANALSKYGAVFNWTYDVASPIPEWFSQIGKNITTLFCNDDDVDEFKNKGLSADYLQIGYDEQIFKPEGPIGSSADIVFMGNNYGEDFDFPLAGMRREMIDRLKNKHGDSFKVYGNGWKYNDGSLLFREQKEAEAYRGCKIAINFSHFDKRRYTSDRMYRLMGSGAFCLTKWYPDIEKDFTDSVHLVVWRDLNELEKLIDFYLNDENENLRKKIASAGASWVSNNCTWAHRMKQLLTMANVKISKEHKLAAPSTAASVPVVPAKNSSKINGYFNKIYCINLDRRVDRWTESSTIFLKNNLVVERVSAVDGVNISGRGHVRGCEIACTMSHMEVLKDMIKNGYNRILVLEDDVDFIPNVQQFFYDNANFIPADWDMLYFGGNHVNPATPVNKIISKISRTYTTSSYGISLKIAQAVLNKLEANSSTKQIDVLYSEFHRGGNCYAFRPSIAWQRPGFSDIQGGETDYRGVIT